MLRDVTQRAFYDFCDEQDIKYRPHKSQNSLTLENGSKILFRSLEKPERLRGTNLAWFGIDELTYCRKEAWLRLEGRLRDPKAKRRCGFGVWTPKGFDWVYRKFIEPGRDSVYTAILARPRENRFLPDDFYDTLIRSYDSRFAAQEVNGEYLNIVSGRLYYAFDRAENVCRQRYIRGLPICWTLDFNVSPMCSVIGQLHADPRDARGDRTFHVLDEIAKIDSNTPEACAEFLKRVEAIAGVREIIDVRVYGDPAGNGRTSTTGKSDYAIVKEFFRTHPQFRATYHVQASAPLVRDRLNAVNGMLRNAIGVRRLFIDPGCKGLTADFEQCVYKLDANGNPTGDIDKSDPMRTHLSDALGYLIETEFGFRQNGGPRSGYIG